MPPGAVASAHLHLAVTLIASIGDHDPDRLPDAERDASAIHRV
jgi:hypothetical protein